MTLRNVALLAALGAALGGGLAVVSAQQPAVDRELEEAKALFREASFAEAIVKLQGAIGRLKLLQNLEARKIQLADAYLHLALSYFALDDRAAAKDTLKGMLRLDGERRLDPQIYAPPVLELLEEARRELAQEAPVAAPARAAATPPAAVKKGGSKALPIVLGSGAAAAGVAVAVGTGGAGGATASPTPSATPTASPAPTPSPSGMQGDIVFLGSSPTPGSTISVSTTLLTMSFSILLHQSGTFNVNPKLVKNATDGSRRACVSGFETVTFTAGLAQTVNLAMRLGPDQCTLPFTTTVLNCYVSDGVTAKVFSLTYTFVP